MSAEAAMKAFRQGEISGDEALENAGYFSLLELQDAAQDEEFARISADLIDARRRIKKTTR